VIQSLTEISTKKVLRTLEMAVAELAGMRQNHLTPDFVLLALLSQPDVEPRSILENLLTSPGDAIERIKQRIRQQYQHAIAVITDSWRQTRPWSGAISPTAANMALDGLEGRLQKRFKGRHKVNTVRLPTTSSSPGPSQGLSRVR